MKLIVNLLVVLLLIGCSATVPMTSRPLKKGEVAFGLTFHFSPERKNENATGWWFGYGIGNNVDVFFDLTTISYPYYFYTEFKNDKSRFEIPSLTIRKNFYAEKNLYYFGLSSFNGSYYDSHAYNNFGAFLGSNFNYLDLSYNPTLFLGYQNTGSVSGDCYRSGILFALINSISSNRSLFLSNNNNFYTLGLSIVPEFWINKSSIKYKNIIYQLNYEAIDDEFWRH